MIATVAIVMLGMVALIAYLMDDRRELPDLEEMVLILYEDEWKLAYRITKNTSNRDWVWFCPELDRTVFPEEVDDWIELPEEE